MKQSKEYDDPTFLNELSLPFKVEVYSYDFGNNLAPFIIHGKYLLILILPIMTLLSLRGSFQVFKIILSSTIPEK